MSKDSITYESQTVEELTADFEGAVDDYLALCEEKGIQPRKPYTGVLYPSEAELKCFYFNKSLAGPTGALTLNRFLSRCKDRNHF